MINDLQKWVEALLKDSGVALDAVPYLRLLILICTLALAAFIVFIFTKGIIVRSIYSFFKRTSVQWDDVLVDKRVFDSLAHIAPAILVKIFAPILFHDFEFLLPVVLKLTDIYLIVVGMIVIISFFKAVESVLLNSPVFADKPISSYIQLIRIILYIATGILILSILMGRSPIYFLSAFGAMTAIILLIFKDTILGLVASIQISSNDMVRVGDWVEMPKFNADGDVIAINLNTVKIKNWDKTITTVPTYYFITDSFKNWRGMQESGGRRIKRSLYINVRTIRFVDPETRERYKKYYLIKDYIEERQKEIEAYNASHDFDTSELINGRRMTNIGVFRKYALAYLKNHKRLNHGMTMLVRQLAPDDKGLPLEIYCFTASIAWVEYEETQADIFDHLFAAASYFGLEIFQQPSGSDIAMAVKALK